MVYRNVNIEDKMCELIIGDEKIDFKTYMEEYFSFEFYKSYFDLIEERKNMEGIITGLSYF